MKNITLAILLLIHIVAFSQSTEHNWVKSKTYQEPESTPILNPQIDEAKTHVSYFDGLGRIIQEIDYGLSTTGKDIVRFYNYDRYSRQNIEYLPFVRQNTPSLSYLYSPLTGLNFYYSSTITSVTENPTFETTSVPYIEKEFDGSPFNRVTKQAAPGEAWAMNSGHEIKFENKINAPNEVRLFDVIFDQNTTENHSLFSNGYYQENKLNKSIIKDENWTPEFSPNYTYIEELDFNIFLNNPNISTCTGSNPIIKLSDETISLEINMSIYPITNLKTGLIHTFDVNIENINLGNLYDIYNQSTVFNVYILNNGLYLQNISTGSVQALVVNEELKKNFSGNEDLLSKNNTVEEFKNSTGQILLKRTFDKEEQHNTYYVYDVYGNLSYVIPPTASDAIENYYDNNFTPRSYPWTMLAEVDERLAEEYNRLFIQYENQFIADEDLFTEYGGQGGFVISKNNLDELNLNINVSTLNPMRLKNGEIVKLDELGKFRDSELGRIRNNDYEYIFYIRNNSLFISGSGEISTLNVSFTGNSRLDYNTNYSWASIINIDPNEARNFESIYRSMDNSVVLTTSIPNNYGATGGLNISIDEDDVVTINLNMSSNVPLALKRGMVIPLNLQRNIADRVLGNIMSNGLNYTFSIKSNSLFIEGEGNFININDVFNGPPPPDITEFNAIIDGLCYIYHYDKRNRLVEKKIPGKGWEFIVYDKLDRPVLTQDANLRLQNKWLFNKYDQFDRIVYTGQFKYISSSGNTEFDLRREVQNHFNSTNSTYLSETKSETSFQNGGIQIHYTNNVFPNLYSQEFTVFTINYYDNYNFQPNGVPLVMPTSITSTNPKTFNTTIATSVKGLQAGSMVKVLGTNNDWIVSLIGYDNKKYNQIWLKSTNSYLQTDDVNEIQYDFVGKVLENKTTHNKAGVTSNLVTIDKFTYDHVDRLLKHSQIIGSQAEQLIAFNKYDELGQLIQKKVGGQAPPASASYNSVNALQTIDYSYNVRGWLTKINNPELSQINKLFSFKINYNDPQLGATPLFNGNISETLWKTQSDNKMRGYKYGYDDMNRIKDADYVGNYNFNGTNQIENYTEGSISYDKNGNILLLSRYGLTNNGTIDKIDELAYSYQPKSNKLIQVIDSGGTAGFSDINLPNSDPDYSYDINGNMTKDVNKEIVDIEYNHLNLPTKISFQTSNITGKFIEYVYDAAGQKLKKIVQQEGLSATQQTQYAGNYIYEKGSFTSPAILKFFSHPEGYVNAEPLGNFSYIYQFKDHLGNIRLSYSDADGNGFLDPETEIIEENNYYPFGLKHQGYNAVVSSGGNSTAQKYQYNGKEWQDELGLNFYDYGWRNYDAAIGRWVNVDPLAEKFPGISSYAYCANNPILFIDPDGRKFINFDENGNYTGTTKDNWFHNTFVGSKGRILDGNGDVTQKFRFADPKNDVADIQSGRISKLITVGESQIQNMLVDAGAFDQANRDNPATFLTQEGRGGGKFDFSFNGIPNEFGIATPTQDANGNWVAPNIFLVDGVAHNHMNFGNFMFGAGGGTLGVSIVALKLGAHRNSRFPQDANGNRIPAGTPNANGYQPQWDSSDDQFSIEAGYHYARGGGVFTRWLGGRRWDRKSNPGKISVGPLTPGIVVP